LERVAARSEGVGLQSTPWSARRNSTVSSRRLGLPTCCAVLPIIRPPDCTNCCPGIGNAKSPPLPP